MIVDIVSPFNGSIETVAIKFCKASCVQREFFVKFTISREKLGKRKGRERGGKSIKKYGGKNSSNSNRKNMYKQL
nr:hypothetical protein BAU18_14190 [Enterococcus diestrammenae]